VADDTLWNDLSVGSVTDKGWKKRNILANWLRGRKLTEDQKKWLHTIHSICTIEEPLDDQWEQSSGYGLLCTSEYELFQGIWEKNKSEFATGKNANAFSTYYKRNGKNYQWEM
jgi:hypothetical protein